MSRALITVVPFGQVDPAVLGLLDEAGIEYVINPIGRRLTEDELVSLVPGFDVLIAGTEPITKRVMEAALQLRLISRVGVGLDSVDLLEARARGIAVAYTPEGPADAVAEITIGLALSLLRGVHLANAAVRQGVWTRIQGRRLARVTVGVVGVGRIGRRVIRLLAAFGARILANDLAPVTLDEPVRWVDKPTLYREADLVTLHVPLTRLTRNLVGAEELAMMQPSAFLINTCRGGVVDEAALARGVAGRPDGRGCRRHLHPRALPRRACDRGHVSNHAAHGVDVGRLPAEYGRRGRAERRRVSLRRAARRAGARVGVRDAGVREGAGRVVTPAGEGPWSGCCNAGHRTGDDGTGETDHRNRR